MKTKSFYIVLISIMTSICMLTSPFVANPTPIEQPDETTSPPFSFTHTVFAEEATATWCGFCPAVIVYLDNIWDSGQYDWYYVTLVDDKNTHAAQRINELGVTGFPTVVYDGGYTRVVGDTNQQDHENAIVNCGNRNVADVDLDITAAWMGGGQISVTAEVTNNEGSTYNGHLHVYVTEIDSRWSNSGTQYHFAMLGDYAINQNVQVSAGSTTSVTNTWTGSGISQNNIKVIGSVFAQSNMYTDETAAADPEDPNSNPPSTPSQPTGPSSGSVGIEYTFSTSSTEPNGDSIKYGWDWNGDDTVDEWTELNPSGDTVETTHAFDSTGTYNVKVKAKDQFGDESSFSSDKEVEITIGSAPSDPSAPSGETQGLHSKSYQYTTSTTDVNPGDKLFYKFDWDDFSETDWVGPFDSGATVTASHSWDELGTYNIKVKAKDLAGSESDWSEETEVFMGNTPPDIPDRPDGPISGIVGKSYKFTSFTKDSENDDIEYLFDWGDGTDSGWISNPFAEHTWVESGEFGIRVKARDQWDESDWSPFLIINLDEGSLNVNIDANPTVAIVGEPIEFSASTTEGTAPYSYEWNFGDGNTSTVQNPTHTYETVGSYIVTVSVTDDIGAFGSNFVGINISLTRPPETPTVNASSTYLPGLEQGYTFNAVDPEGDDVYLMIDWGDGTITDWLGPYASGQDVLLTHTYTGGEDYTIKAKAKDANDFESDWSQGSEVEVQWFQAFLVGTVQVENVTEETLEWRAVSVFYFSRNGGGFKHLNSLERLIIQADSGGFKGKNFVFGMFLTGAVMEE